MQQIALYATKRFFIDNLYVVFRCYLTQALINNGRVIIQCIENIYEYITQACIELPRSCRL